MAWPVSTSGAFTGRKKLGLAASAISRAFRKPPERRLLRLACPPVNECLLRFAFGGPRAYECAPEKAPKIRADCHVPAPRTQSEARCPGHRALCRRPGERAGRGEGLQALGQREPARSKPGGGVGLRRGAEKSRAISRRQRAGSA